MVDLAGNFAFLSDRNMTDIQSRNMNSLSRLFRSLSFRKYIPINGFPPSMSFDYSLRKLLYEIQLILSW